MVRTVNRGDCLNSGSIRAIQHDLFARPAADLAAGLAVHRLPELEFYLCVGLLYFLVLVFVVNSKFGGVYR